MLRVMRLPTLLRARLPLLIAAYCSELAYLGFFLRQFPLLHWYRRDVDMGNITGHSHWGMVGFVVATIELFTLFGIAWWLSRDLDDRATLWIVLGAGAVFLGTMVYVYPVTAIDIYAYIQQSWILVHYHQNPIFVAPQSYPHDPLMAYARGWQSFGSPYGPLGIIIDAIPVAVTRGDLLGSLILLKAMFSLMALGTAYVVYEILRVVRPRYAVSGALLVAWNPLVVIEVGSNGHNDIAMMFLTSLAVLAMVRRHYAAGPLLLLAAVLVKYTVILLIPLFLVYGFVRHPDLRAKVVYLASTVAWMYALAAVAYFPFWNGIDTITRLTGQSHRYVDSFSTLFTSLIPIGISLDQAAFLGWVLFVPFYNYALMQSTGEIVTLLRSSFLVLFAFLALGTSNVEGWYALWPVVLGAAVPRLTERLAAALLSFGATISAILYGYIWVWMGLRDPHAFTVVNNLSYLVTFLPASLVLAGITLWKKPLAVRAEREPTRV
ncbi:MAG TPA: hypothetical protein VF221_13060 [Chloroflexota bacterium]